MSDRSRANDTPVLIGLMLVAIAIVALGNVLITDAADLRDTLTFGGLAVVLLVAAIWTRSQAALIAALAFAGLSIAKYNVMNGEDSGGSVLFWPGVGFLVAWVVTEFAMRPAHWWPLVPGAVMALLGGLLVFGGQQGRDLAGLIWPIVFVGLAVLVYATLAAMRQPARPREEHRPT